ncbi:hypothetical protein J3A83DRAFT_4361060 [Scleroderma citrinum]
MSLYADNTTTILSKWCIASGAKFNLEKTEIIPLGSEDHHERVYTTQKITASDLPLPQPINIMTDRAWIEPILGKVKSALKSWNKSHPALDTKCHIVQMTAATQGMPRHIKTMLISIIQDFIWESSLFPMISKGGGINLLNIHASNKAIDIIRLKTYMNLSSRPKWAFLIDVIINTLHPNTPPK